MPESFFTPSPKANLADLFLNTFEGAGLTLGLGRRQKELSETFNLILNNSVERLSAQDLPRPAADENPAPRPFETEFGPNPLPASRQSALEEMEDQLEEIGIPINSLHLSEDDLPKLKKVLQDSGLTDKEAEAVVARLADGPLNMGRVLAIVKSVKVRPEQILTLTADSLPSLGQFLQEAGLGPDVVKEVLETLKPGQHFGAEDLRELLLKYSDKNLKGPVLAGVDPQNLKKLLESLGVPEKDMKNFAYRMNQTGGRLSLEAFVGFLESVERPKKLATEALENVRDIIKGLKSTATMKARPHFSRIVSLLQSLGDKDIDSKFLSNNPAIQALRGGAASARAVTQGTGALGQGDSGTGGKSGQFSGQLAGGETASKPGQTGGTARPPSGPLPSRLSESVARQVAEKMTYQAGRGRQRMNIQLVPRELGRVNISLVMNQSSLQASIVAENPAVKAALEDQMAQLREALAQQGLDLERFDVSLGWDRQPNDFEDQEDRPFSFARGRDRTDEIEEETPSLRPEVQADPGRVDRVV